MQARKMLTIAMAAAMAMLFSSLAWVGNAVAVQTVSTGMSMPVHLQGAIETFDCSNAPGPQITLEGSLSLGGVNVQLIFRNNINKDVHTRQEDVQVVVGVAVGDQIVIPKQPVQGGAGGNPFIWLQLIDTSGNPLTGEVFLGRCVQGVFAPAVDFWTPTLAQAIVAVVECSNHPGPVIDVSGSLSFAPGVKARFIFRNNDNPVGGPHEADAIADVMLIPTGFTLEFPKQPVQGGVGGNPWISVRFLDGSGDPVGEEFLLGRCVKL